MFLGGAGHAQRFTSPSGVVLRVDRPLWFGIFEHRKGEDMPKKLLNFRIKVSGGKKRNSIPIVVASELRKAQYGHPSFPALVCGDGLYVVRVRNRCNCLRTGDQNRRASCLSCAAPARTVCNFRVEFLGSGPQSGW